MQVYRGQSDYGCYVGICGDYGAYGVRLASTGVSEYTPIYSLYPHTPLRMQFQILMLNPEP